MSWNKWFGFYSERFQNKKLQDKNEMGAVLQQKLVLRLHTEMMKQLLLLVAVLATLALAEQKRYDG